MDFGPEVVRYLEDHTPFRLAIENSCDYYSELPGGKARGRQLVPDAAQVIPAMKEAEKKKMMERLGSNLTSTETVLFELLKVAEGEKFKAISQIVR